MLARNPPGDSYVRRRSSIALFLFGTAIAFGLTTVTLAGWTNRVLVVSLFGVAAILFICSIFWSTIGENWIGLRIFLHDLIANYFGFRAVGLVIFLMFCFDFAIKIGWISTKKLDNVTINKQSTRLNNYLGSEANGESERVFVDTTPLTGLFKDKLEIHGEKLAQPYIGKWLRVDGKVNDVYHDYISLRVGVISSIFFDFDIVRRNSLHTLQSNQQISVIGQIRRIGEDHLFLAHCELLFNTYI